MPTDPPIPPDPAELGRMAALLDASGQYRVLRRIVPQAPIEPPVAVPTRLGLLLDLETTGLDPLQHEIIKFAMLPFTYGLDGTAFTVGEPFSRLRQPSQPMPWSPATASNRQRWRSSSRPPPW